VILFELVNQHLAWGDVGIGGGVRWRMLGIHYRLPVFSGRTRPRRA
jgi:hypothetical protein